MPLAETLQPDTTDGVFPQRHSTTFVNIAAFQAVSRQLLLGKTKFKDAYPATRLTILAMAFPQPRRRSDFQVAIICALPLEYDAAALAFDQFWSWDQIESGSEGHDNYRIGRIGRHNAVLALLPGMGKVNATSAATSLKATFDGLKLAILTGICGGVPRPKTGNDEIMLGDVAVSKGIVQYDFARQYPDRLARKDTLGDNLGRPNKDIRTLLATFETQLGLDDLQYQAAQALSGIQQKAIDTGHRIGYNRPTEVGDVLFEPDYVHRHRDHRGCGCCESNACEQAISASCEEIQCDTGHCVPRRPLAPGRNRDFRIHIGHIGSGDTVMKSGLHRDGIAAEHGLIAFEMEAAGIWDEIPCIVTKGVCDYADSHKNKSWQNFAAATGAATTKAIIGFYTPMKMIEASSSWFIVPYGQNYDFVSRTDILDQIKRLFGHDQSPTLATRRQPRVALHGLGGIGRTFPSPKNVTYQDVMIPKRMCFRS
nr:kinesin light chain [Colletotrichum truncatum]KAF6788932.1 kinesin light chain [Colletotrichum truncatum]